MYQTKRYFFAPKTISNTAEFSQFQIEETELNTNSGCSRKNEFKIKIFFIRGHLFIHIGKYVHSHLTITILYCYNNKIKCQTKTSKTIKSYAHISTNRYGTLDDRDEWSMSGKPVG